MTIIHLRFKKEYADSLEFLGSTADQDFYCREIQTVDLVNEDVILSTNFSRSDWVEWFNQSDLSAKYDLLSPVVEDGRTPFQIVHDWYSQDEGVEP